MSNENKKSDDTTTESFVITNEILLHRLDAGLAITGGARGSLTKCAVQLLQQQSGEEESSKATTIKKKYYYDLQLQQIEMTKLLLRTNRNEREIERLQNEIQNNSKGTQIKQEQQTDEVDDEKDIQELRDELHKLQQVQSCLNEYEALAKLTVGQHKISEYQLQKELQSIQTTNTIVKEELQIVKSTCNIRQKQFHVLQNYIQDMKISLLAEQPFQLVDTSKDFIDNNEDDNNDNDDNNNDNTIMNEEQQQQQPSSSSANTAKVDEDGDTDMVDASTLQTQQQKIIKIIQPILKKETTTKNNNNDDDGDLYGDL